MKLRNFERDEAIFQGADAEAAFERAKATLLGFRFYEPMVRAKLPPGGLAADLRLEQRIRIGPLRLRGPVLVTEAWDLSTADGREAGFRYEALPAHAERGTATFFVRLVGDEVRFHVESDSAPAKWYVKMGSPVGRWVQRRAVSLGFRNMQAAANGNAKGMDL